MKILITSKAEAELQFKITTASETPGLRESYGYTEDELNEFSSRVDKSLSGRSRANVEVDYRDLRFIAGEMGNAADIAEDNIGCCGPEADREYRNDLKCFRRLADKAEAMLSCVVCHGIEMVCLPVTRGQDHSDWKTRRYWRRQVDEKRAEFAGSPDKVYVKNGVLYWKPVDRPVPVDVLRNDAKLAPTPEQVAAYQSYLDQSLAEYRANPPKLTDEDRFEMRAAFGPGVTVVNALTGKRTVT